MSPARTTTGPGDAVDPVLVVGGTGFIGSAIVRELLGSARASAAPRLRVLASRRPPAAAVPDGVEFTTADLTDPASLRGACAGVTTLVHTASYVGRDAARCDAVNHTGTLALLDEARRAGVRRVLYISTASVYGSGPHRGAAEGELTPGPQSAASASRLAAEAAVLDAGGVVLRPHLVSGVGDRWVVPTLARLLRRVPDWPTLRPAHSSMIAVDDLARLVGALVRQGQDGDGDGDEAAGQDGGGQVYHAAHPRPVCMRSLVFALGRLLGLPPPRGALSLQDHRELVTRSVPELSDHQYALLTQDHWYDSSRIWDRTRLEPGPGPIGRFAECAGWYERELRVPVAG
ncbi:NAD-dependent epimerase/dehydratase family protein [Streptomyces sp. NPDC059009]|uniref:NAD-dependent epimerase/dehydratase family protein n=1 Tax=Streptomyces sp. NPDC059009 TaxID=3346694 RepID=UPI0036BED06E